MKTEIKCLCRVSLNSCCKLETMIMIMINHFFVNFRISIERAHGCWCRAMTEPRSSLRSLDRHTSARSAPGTEFRPTTSQASRIPASRRAQPASTPACTSPTRPLVPRLTPATRTRSPRCTLETTSSAVERVASARFEPPCFPTLFFFPPLLPPISPLFIPSSPCSSPSPSWAHPVICSSVATYPENFPLRFLFHSDLRTSLCVFLFHSANLEEF